MKVNITVHPYELSGYKNISPLNGDNILNLPFEAAECKEIIAEDIIDFINYDQIESTIKNYASKLRHGGKLILGGTDIFEVSKQCMMNAVGIEQINELLYGKLGNNRFIIKKSCSTILHVLSIVQALGLKIDKQRLDETSYIVEAHRE